MNHTQFIINTLKKIHKKVQLIKKKFLFTADGKRKFNEKKRKNLNAIIRSTGGCVQTVDKAKGQLSWDFHYVDTERDQFLVFLSSNRTVSQQESLGLRVIKQARRVYN